MAVGIFLLILSVLSVFTTFSLAFYIEDEIGINTHSDPVDESGHYYSVGTTFRQEITRQQFDAWRLCQRWIFAMFFVTNISTIGGLTILGYAFISRPSKPPNANVHVAEEGAA